jgi:transmembrane 9 superfamily protein 2/4
MPLTVTDAFGTRISWTYGVTWVEEPDIHWASRWDSYLHTSVADVNNRIHWMSIINTVLIVLCLSSTVAVVILRSLKKDLARYNAMFDLTKDEQLEAQKEECGWKVVHGDVFRTPRRAMALTVLTASGVQLLAMVACTLFVACLGFLSPANRGGLMTALLLIFVVQACFAGYFAARMHVKLGGEPRCWKVVLYTAVFLPSVIFAVFISVNFILKSVRSSGALPLGSLLILLAMWIFVALPLAFIGASFGFRVVPEPPARKVNSIPRPIDEASHPFYLQDGFVILGAGVIPFAALFLELKFILASLWQGMVYYVFGFLAAVFLLWIVTAALTAMVVVYYRLCAENYHWWWVSFLAPTSMGINLFLFFVYYFNTQLSIQSTAATYIFYLYMMLVTFFYVLTGGAVGFLSSWFFVHVIYSSVKID